MKHGLLENKFRIFCVANPSRKLITLGCTTQIIQVLSAVIVHRILCVRCTIKE
ncbi:hypothetical protein Plhal304r1_c017g0060971 [Plasmopara halstedii]